MTNGKPTAAVLAVGLAALLVAEVAMSAEFVDAKPAALAIGPESLDPARLVETRNGPADTTSDGQLQGVGTRPADSVLVVPVLGRGGVPATGVGAVMLNVTAVNPAGPGFVTVYPAFDNYAMHPQPAPSGTFVELRQTGDAYGDKVCGLKSDGDIVCSLASYSNHIGIGTLLDDESQSTISGPFTTFDVSTDFGCGIRPDRTLACWGANNVGQATPPTA